MGAQKETSEDLLLYNGDLSIVMLNKYPYNNGHTMVSPKRHTADFTSLSAEESLDMTRLINNTISALKKLYSPCGFNVGINLGTAAGAGIADHLHWHVVPRWSGDTNFMPVLSEVRVIPLHLEQTLTDLLPFFKDI